MRHLLAFTTTLFLLISLSGCTDENNIDLSGEEIIDNTLAALQSPISYYGEFEGNDGEYGEWNKYKEWARSDGKHKVKRKDQTNETVDMYDGEKLYLYDKENGMVAALKRSYKDMAFSSNSLRLRSEFGLNLAKEMCDLTVVGEEKVAGRNTYHIVAKRKGDQVCIGEPEYWIDQEHWMVLKTFEDYHKDQQITLQYTKIDFDAEISDEALAFDFPEGAGINNIVDPEESTIEEAKEKLGKFYQMPVTAELRLSQIKIYEEIKERPEFTFDYTKDGEPELSVVVFPSVGEIDFGSFQDEEIININDQKRIIIKNPEDMSVIWLEDGLHYTVRTTNGAVSEEELVRYVNSMVKK